MLLPEISNYNNHSIIIKSPSINNDIATRSKSYINGKNQHKNSQGQN